MTINHALLDAYLERLIEARAHAVGAQLIEDLSHPGQGTLHEGNVNTSSMPGDYPAIQTGALIESINVVPAGHLTYAVGSFEDQSAEGFAHAVELESRPPSMGGRAFLEKALHDPEIHQAALTGKGP
jgi:hypothetical protein